jgi:predicted nuclease of predicted toxin-antitoxin system
VARLYADENIPLNVVMHLRAKHDVLTCQEAGQAGARIPDEEVLAFAHAASRAVLTHNRKHFRHLHESGCPHSGIVICTEDRDWDALAARIDAAIGEVGELAGRLVRIVRPAP